APPGEDCVDYGFEIGALGCQPFCAPDFRACRRSGWTELPNTGGGNVYGIWGTSQNDLFAVSLNGGIRRWNGTTWTSMTSGTSSDLNAVRGTSASDIFAVGESGTIVRWNDAAWSTMTSGVTMYLNAV